MDQLQQRIDERFEEQLRIMQKEQQAGVETLQQRMDKQLRSMQDSARKRCKNCVAKCSKKGQCCAKTCSSCEV